MMKAGFNISELKANILDYSIKFQGENHQCVSINSSDKSAMYGGKIWILSNYSNCGIEAYNVGNDISFEQHIIIEYGKKSAHNLVYRYFNDTYRVRCLLNRNVTKDLTINVKERKTLKTVVSKFYFPSNLTDTC